MATYTLTVSDNEMRLMSLALRKWDGWTDDGTISEDDEDTCLELAARLSELRDLRNQFCRS